MSAAEAYYPIRKVSEMTGINAVTLRSWERRHQLVNPVRSASGQRLYSQSNLDQINEILRLLEKDIPISQVQHVLADSYKLPVSVENISWQVFQNEMLAATQRFDERALLETYNETLGLFGISEVTDQLLIPVLKTLGEQWAEGKTLVAEEHFFQLFVRNKIGARFHHQQHRRYQYRIVTACFSKEQHELGLLLFSLYARENNVDVIMLGTDIPIEEMAEVSRRGKCEAIVFSGGFGVDLAESLPKLKALIKTTDVPVFIGGNLSKQDERQLKNINAIPVGSNIAMGLAMINAQCRKHKEAR